LCIVEPEASVRILIAADIHSNLVAFEAVLRDAERGGAIDSIWSPGDIVGYGPEPTACIELLRHYEHAAVGGNHDYAAVGALSTVDFNASAAAAIAWTATRLSDDDKRFLASLPQVLIEGDFTFVHGSLRSPVWEYLTTPLAARDQFQRMETPYSIVGHSHLPFVAEEIEGGRVHMERWSDGETVELGEHGLIVNPGGVGQPRDGDPRASYALYDTEARMLTLHRVEYDIEATQRQMLAVGLPPWLAERLSYGQ
jgi:diadenosine tetraphosphatase ApaH/serine/threonine PP2A family protein phosphatase